MHRSQGKGNPQRLKNNAQFSERAKGEDGRVVFEPRGGLFAWRRLPKLLHVALFYLALTLLLAGLTGCKRKVADGGSLALSARSSVSAESIRQLIEQKNGIQRWALRCGTSVAKDDCSVGDAALFNGLLCLSGDELACEAVRRSQGSDGRLWRAEFRIASDAVNSFSRDMALGVLAYLVATKDRDLAVRWMSWIEKNDFRLCRESSDTRCDFSPGFWMLFREVWEFLGLEPNEKMRSAVLEDSVMALLQAHFSPAGFEMHLAGVNALIRKSMGQRSSTLQSLADVLAQRQPKNPFYAYLSLGAQPLVIEKTIAWCPSGQPQMRAEWSFERDQDSSAWLRSMGWECVMLINFIVRDSRAATLDRSSN